MTKLPWWIPQKRDLHDTNVYSNVVTVSDLEEDSSSVKSSSTIKTNGSLPAIRLDNGKYAKIKEFRDEANRPWWKFFDEFEYRESSEKSKAHKWYHWFEPGTSAAEKKLIWKLDFLIAFYSFLGYWIKYIDSSNLNNAYVSNMKEDLGMKGNDLIDTQVLFNVGNIIFELPMMFLLPRVPINYFLFVCELGWALFTVGLYDVKTVAGLKALRFFVGSFEAAYFPIVHYTLANWYKSAEISRRGAIFYMGQFLGVLTSGLLQSATFKNLNGVHGIAGWRWMFLIDGIISVVVALIGLIVLPGTPFSCYSIWLTDEEILLARKRMHDNGTDTSYKPKSFFDKQVWKKTFSTWHVYLLSIIQMQGFNTNNTASGSFALWLKSLDRYSIPKINNLTAAPPAVGIFYIIIICFGADLTKKRFGFIIFSYIMNFIGNVILAIWDVSEPAKWFAFMSAYWSWSQSSVFNPLISDLFRKDNNVRAIGWMVQYIMGLQSSAWISKLVWPTVEAPRFLKGFASCAAFSMGFNLCLILVYFLYKRDERNEALENGIYLYNSKIEGVPEIVRKYQNKTHGETGYSSSTHTEANSKKTDENVTKDGIEVSNESLK